MVGIIATDCEGIAAVPWLQTAGERESFGALKPAKKQKQMKTLQEIRDWLNKPETWEQDLDGLDRPDIVDAVLRQVEPIIEALQKENEKLKLGSDRGWMP